MYWTEGCCIILSKMFHSELRMSPVLELDSTVLRSFNQVQLYQGGLLGQVRLYTGATCKSQTDSA